MKARKLTAFKAPTPIIKAFLQMLGAAKGRRPRPLKIVPTEPSGHIQSFANDIEARQLFDFKGFRRHGISRDASQGHLCGAVALCTTGLENPSVQAIRKFAQILVRKFANTTVIEPHAT